MMIERLLLLMLLAALASAGMAVWRWWLGRRTDSLGRGQVPDVLRRLALPSRPAVLYFTTADCAQCRLRQAPLLARAARGWGEAVHVAKLDAVAHETLAQHFGLLTVPSTVVLDCDSRVRAVNHGLADAARLESQVRPLIEQHEARVCLHSPVAAQALRGM